LDRGNINFSVTTAVTTNSSNIQHIIHTTKYISDIICCGHQLLIKNKLVNFVLMVKTTGQINYSAVFKQECLTEWEGGKNKSHSLRGYAQEKGVPESTFRQWLTNKATIESTTDMGVIYVKQNYKTDGALSRLKDKMKSPSFMPTTTDVVEHILSHEPSLLDNKSYHATRRFAERLLKRARTESSGYVEVDMNEVFDVKKARIYKPCGCKIACSTKCKNRIRNHECCDKTCSVGSECGNRSFQQNNEQKTEKRDCGDKGYGLFAVQGFEENELIIEYKGAQVPLESIEEMEKRGRARYLMQVTKSFFIDAAIKGNNARYINHSCKPNAMAQLRYVHQQPCVGLFAINSMEPGTEIVFDYGNKYRLNGACKCDHCKRC
jgi:hypothetical protein